LRRELGIDPAQPVIGTVAQLRPEKALDVLIDATAKLRDKYPGLHLVIAGEGREREPLERLIAAQGMQGAVHLLGYRLDVPDVLASFDVAVCCSDFEGGPLSVMEYMDAGLPIVATDVGGLPELIEDGVSGLLVPPRDPAALAGAIEALLEDQTKAERLGREARERGRRHGVDAWVARIEALYDELLSSQAGANGR
jgi:glycosyltransferase involved in cell wall biosynthesis